MPNPFERPASRPVQQEGSGVRSIPLRSIDLYNKLAKRGEDTGPELSPEELKKNVESLKTEVKELSAKVTELTRPYNQKIGELSDLLSKRPAGTTDTEWKNFIEVVWDDQAKLSEQAEQAAGNLRVELEMKKKELTKLQARLPK